MVFLSILSKDSVMHSAIQWLLTQFHPHISPYTGPSWSSLLITMLLKDAQIPSLNSGSVIWYVPSPSITYHPSLKCIHYSPRNLKNQRVRIASVSLPLHLVNAGLWGSAPRCLSRGPERFESAKTSRYVTMFYPLPPAHPKVYLLLSKIQPPFWC